MVLHNDLKNTSKVHLKICEKLSVNKLNIVNSLLIKCALEMNLFSLAYELTEFGKIKSYEDFLNRFNIFDKIFKNLSKEINGMIWFRTKFNEIVTATF